MAEGERDSTQDWLLPAERRPATMLELEQRVDVALAIAKGAETAALEIGEAALDAAQQAHRAAELAERVAGGAEAGRVAAPPNGAESPAANGDEPGDERLRIFTERADRVVARLRALERLPERVG